MIKRATLTSPQVSNLQYLDGYDSSKRWSSYWIQIEQAMQQPNGAILEVGLGNGVVVNYLREVGKREVTTLDIDPDLHPDVVADVVDLPFGAQSFDLVMACEVLEHIPYSEAASALSELRRVGKNAIISVPNSGFSVRLELSIAKRDISFRLDLPWLRKRRNPRVQNEHFWELEIEGFPRGRFETVIEKSGWTIKSRIRNPQNLFHHFYILE